MYRFRLRNLVYVADNQLRVVCEKLSRRVELRRLDYDFKTVDNRIELFAKLVVDAALLQTVDPTLLLSLDFGRKSLCLLRQSAHRYGKGKEHAF